ncbi:MAG TPA: cupin domain-containing protein [Phenylobacterium sp.]|uniref:cupin domain-containing protein n=1 Tax=Phenylobacterium sp. TaxID=1871053 RepID=UPI002B464BCC|nr:cupin domain-containing protein [Phenylobacterium sp.]HKR88467.1 cupin domain-containing protein [Phenylobacterium sp.]
MASPETLESDARVNQPTPFLEHEISSPADLQALRDLWKSLPRIPKLVQGDEAPVISNTATQCVRLALASEESAGAVQVCHTTLLPGIGAPMHHQPQEDELWFVVEGEFVWTVGNLKQTVRTGGFAYIPRNTTHAFENVTDRPAVMFAINMPGGHERGFMAAAKMRAGGRPNEQVRAALADYDFHFHQVGDHPAGP